jgi:phage terminase large subunit
MPKIELPFEYTPRNYQMPTWQFFMNGGKRAVGVWHRRAGKDLFGINLCATMSAMRKGLYWHVLPTYKQGRQIVWEGYTRDGRRFLDAFPKESISALNNTEMRIKLKWGSTYQVVGSDDPDRLVGTNPVGVIFSEYSLQDPRAWNLIRPILAENGGWAFFNYTARGKNHGYHLAQMAMNNPKWHCEVLKAGSGEEGTKKPDGSPVISDEIIDDDRKSGMDEATIQSEYFCSFEAPIVGSYYGRQLLALDKKGQIGRVPWEPKLPVTTSWDLGMGDATGIWFWQTYGFERRYIDYYENSGEGLAHYAKMLAAKPYHYGVHWGPHDAKVRELGTGVSRIETLAKMGIRMRVVPAHMVEDGIERVRNTLPCCWFDEEACAEGLGALRSYRKDKDEARSDGVHDFYRNTPFHDWTSHGADSFRYSVMSKSVGSKRPSNLQSHQMETGFLI